MKSYLKGYKRGRHAGYRKGYQQGMTQGLQNTLWPIALIITTSKELPSFKMMLFQPFNQMKKLGQYNFRVRTEDTVSQNDIALANTVIFIRNVEPNAYRYLEMAHQMGKQTVYCIDDNFLEIPPGIHAPYYQNPSRRETFINFLRNAQIVHVNSEYFADYIRLHFNSHVVYFPATVDFEWLEHAVKPERQDGQIVIGYEGTYKEDSFEPVVPAIKRLLGEYGSRIRVEFFGFIPSTLQEYPGITHIPYEEDYHHFIHKLYQATWDIGLAPLADTFFNHCKTNNKFREYGACMIPGVYSKSPAYTGWINHQETGYIVPNTEEGWYEGINQMIKNPSLRHKIREQARAYAREQFSIDACVVSWRNQILH